MTKLINPSFTVQNTEGPHWIVTFEHAFNEDERVFMQVKVSKSNAPIVQIEREAFDRATELLQLVSRSIGDGA